MIVNKGAQNSPRAETDTDQSKIKVTRTVVSPNVAWLPKVATLSAEVVIVASASSVLVGGEGRST